MELHTGTCFDIHEPTFDIEEIAHSISMLCRYNGHTPKFYSVAEHSMIVAVLMEQENLGDPLEGLLHDAVEAYVSDIPSPLKEYMTDAIDLERTLDVKLRRHFGIVPEKSYGCHEADRLAMFIEAYCMMPSQGAGRKGEEDYRERAIKLVGEGYRPLNLYPEEAKERFLEFYKELTNEASNT